MEAKDINYKRPDFETGNLKPVEDPYDLLQKGLKYDKLKEQYNKLETRYNKSYAARLKVDAQRDELLEICQLVMKSDIDGSYIVASNWWLKMENLIKSIKNEL